MYLLPTSQGCRAYHSAAFASPQRCVCANTQTPAMTARTRRIAPDILPRRRRGPDHLGISLEILIWDRDYGFLHVFIRLDHALEMERRQLHAPGIGERFAGLCAQPQQLGMTQRDDLLLLRLVRRPDVKLHIHSIRMADGNTGLKPAKLHFPDAAERIG